jgi:DNA (cytosine-5)-methyltransferase 1
MQVDVRKVSVKPKEGSVLPGIVGGACDHAGVPIPDPAFRVVGLFAGIGGLELGFQRAGGESVLLCEVWGPARAVLSRHFPRVDLHDDVRTLAELPDADVVAGGFPCTDLSQAGRTAGIHGVESGLVRHMFRLLENAHPRWVVIENVRNMLVLDQGRAMEYLVAQLERLGYRWAYRLVDSRFTGVPQRRQRVLMVASRSEDPTAVLFAEDVGGPAAETYRTDAYGFYWTEGLRGLGWAQDAIPTLKGGSAIGIPSPPAIWIRSGEPGSAIVTPTIADAELVQGFPAGWTEAAAGHGRPGYRWKLVGNAVTVGVASWLGERLVTPGEYDWSQGVRLAHTDPWPTAGWGEGGQRWLAPVSLWPRHDTYLHLLDLVDRNGLAPLSQRAIDGFASRMDKSGLRFDPAFRVAVKAHAAAMRAVA